MQQPYAPPAHHLHPSKTSGLAIMSLVTALLGLGIIPVIFGHVALSKIKRSMGALIGSGMAIAGLAMGYAQIILFFVLLMIFVHEKKKASDRAGCILNQHDVQIAVRSYQDLHGMRAGDRIDWKEVFSADKYIKKEPMCPKHGKYTFKANVPEVGELVVECSLSAQLDNHVPGDHHDW